jgi:hypothetical protein
MRIRAGCTDRTPVGASPDARRSCAGGAPPDTAKEPVDYIILGRPAESSTTGSSSPATEPHLTMDPGTAFNSTRTRHLPHNALPDDIEGVRVAASPTATTR